MSAMLKRAFWSFIMPATCAGGALVVSPALQREDQGRVGIRVPEGRRNMGHTYAINLIHCIFSTKNREDLIPPDRMPTLFSYFGGIAKGEGFKLITAGGTANHLHLLIELPPSYPLANAMQKLKGSSSHWIGPGFAWQEGYGAFSVSPSQGSKR